MEVDGGSHLLEETIVKDDLKDYYLEKTDIVLLRFISDKGVLIDIKNIIRTITYEIDKILPLPPPEGDRLLGNDNELSAAVSPKASN